MLDERDPFNTLGTFLTKSLHTSVVGERRNGWHPFASNLSFGCTPHAAQLQLPLGRNQMKVLVRLSTQVSHRISSNVFSEENISPH